MSDSPIPITRRCRSCGADGVLHAPGCSAGNSTPPIRTREERMEGYAMSIAICRGEVIKLALQLLEKNTYESLQEARKVLKAAADNLEEDTP